MPKDDPRPRLVRQAAAARAREAAARAEAEGLEETLRRLTRELAASTIELAKREGIPVPTSLLRVHAPLTKVHPKGTLGTVDVQKASAGSQVSRAKTKHPWPFSVALHAHGSSPAAWAALHEADGAPGHETVRAWLKAPGKGGRPCPGEWADFIEAEFAGTETPVPARDSSWPNKIRRNP